MRQSSQGGFAERELPGKEGMLLLKVGVVIPAHNEAENLQKLLPEIFVTLEGLYEVDVLVVGVLV